MRTGTRPLLRDRPCKGSIKTACLSLDQPSSVRRGWGQPVKGTLPGGGVRQVSPGSLWTRRKRPESPQCPSAKSTPSWLCSWDKAKFWRWSHGALWSPGRPQSWRTACNKAPGRKAPAYPSTVISVASPRGTQRQPDFPGSLHWATQTPDCFSLKAELMGQLGDFWPLHTLSWEAYP